MSIPCYSDFFQQQLLLELDKYQKKQHSNAKGNLATISKNGQLYDAGFCPLLSSEKIDSYLNSIKPVQKEESNEKSVENGFVFFDGSKLVENSIDLNSVDGIKSLDKHINSAVQKNYFGPDYLLISNDSSIIPSGHIVDAEANGPLILRPAASVEKYINSRYKTLEQSTIPNFDLDSKISKPKDSGFCTVSGSVKSSNLYTSFDLSKKLNTLNKLYNNTGILQFSDDGQLYSDKKFPKTSFTELISKTEISDIHPDLFQDKFNLDLQKNSFIKLENNSIISVPIYTSEQYKSDVDKIIKTDDAKPGAFVDSNSKTYSNVVDAQTVKSLVEKKKVLSGNFSKVQENFAVFDSVAGTISQVNSSTLLLKGIYFLEIFLNGDASNSCNITICDTVHSILKAGEFNFHYSNIISHNGNWNLELKLDNCVTLKQSKIILIEK